MVDYCGILHHRASHGGTQGWQKEKQGLLFPAFLLLLDCWWATGGRNRTEALWPFYTNWWAANTGTAAQPRALHGWNASRWKSLSSDLHRCIGLQGSHRWHGLLSCTFLSYQIIIKFGIIQSRNLFSCLFQLNWIWMKADWRLTCSAMFRISRLLIINGATRLF